MSPLLPAPPTPVEPAGAEINRHFLVEQNGGSHVIDGGRRAPSLGVAEVRMTFVLSDLTPQVGDELESHEPIDYAVWTKAVQPASRAGFEDTLDYVDLFDD